MPHVCALIIAMQLTCIVDKEIVYVVRDKQSIGFLLSAGQKGYHAFDQDGRPIGLFKDEDRAAKAVYEAATDTAVRINRRKYLPYKIVNSWRRGRDSNPRYGCPYAAFRVRCIQPLCHLSKPLRLQHNKYIA